MTGHAERARARHAARLASFGTNFLRLRGNLTLSAVVVSLSDNEEDNTLLEGGINALEVHPLKFDHMPPGTTSSLRVGDYVVYPSTGDTKKDRYVVTHVVPQYELNVETHVIAILRTRPEA
jgi:hypothetical protein